MKRSIAIILCVFAAVPLVAQGAKTPRSTNKDAGSIIIVFKDGHRQTIRRGDIARIEFSQPEAAADSAAVPASNQPLPGRNHFVGKWKVGQGGGSSRAFFITLKDDGHAEKSIGASHGTWELVGGEARIAWDDGWHDAIRKVGSKHEKFAFEPGTSFTDKPANVTDAQPTEPRL